MNMSDVCKFISDSIAHALRTFNWKAEQKQEKANTIEQLANQIHEIEACLVEWREETQDLEKQNHFSKMQLDQILQKVNQRIENLSASDKLLSASLIRKIAHRNQTIESIRKEYDKFEETKELFELRIKNFNNSTLTARFANLLQSAQTNFDIDKYKNAALDTADKLQEAKIQNQEIKDVQDDVDAELAASGPSTEQMLQEYIEKRPANVLDLLSPEPQPNSPNYDESDHEIDLELQSQQMIRNTNVASPKVYTKKKIRVEELPIN